MNFVVFVANCDESRNMFCNTGNDITARTGVEISRD